MFPCGHRPLFAKHEKESITKLKIASVLIMMFPLFVIVSKSVEFKSAIVMILLRPPPQQQMISLFVIRGNDYRCCCVKLGFAEFE